MALRKIIEQNSYTSKFIFELINLTNFSKPLLSRFLQLRIKAPTFDEIKGCIINYSLRKNINISEDKIEYIIKNSSILENTYNFSFNCQSADFSGTPFKRPFA
jgi:hypothetical protein